MNDLIWDADAISDYFLFDTEERWLDRDEMCHGIVHRGSDGVQRCEFTAEPELGVVFVSVWSEAAGVLTTDLSVIARSPLSVRGWGAEQFVYCHECVIGPGIHGFGRRDVVGGMAMMDLDAQPSLSFALTIRPVVSIRILMPDSYRGASWHPLRPDTR